MQEWIAEFNNRRQTVHSVRCPIDVGRLDAYVSSPASLELFKPRNVPRGQPANPKTGRALVTAFLASVTRTSATDGHIDICYRFSELGDQMVAAGFLVQSRVWTAGCAIGTQSAK